MVNVYLVFIGVMLARFIALGFSSLTHRGLRVDRPGFILLELVLLTVLSLQAFLEGVSLNGAGLFALFLGILAMSAVIKFFNHKHSKTSRDQDKLLYISSRELLKGFILGAGFAFNPVFAVLASFLMAAHNLVEGALFPFHGDKLSYWRRAFKYALTSQAFLGLGASVSFALLLNSSAGLTSLFLSFSGGALLWSVLREHHFLKKTGQL